jgi:Tfp pilus assembly protein PilN
MNIKINLLPEEKKWEIRKKRNFRLIFWQGFAFLSLGLIYAGILFTIHISLNVQLNHIQEVNNPEESRALQELEEHQELFRQTNLAVKKLSYLQKEHIRWSGMFKETEHLVPEGILLSRIMTENDTVSFTGQASTREILLDFQSKLNSSTCFENAQVPLSDLFSQKDIEFQLNTTMKKECLKPYSL